MLESPFRYDPTLTDAEFKKLGQLALRWSHIEHIIGNCLKVMLRQTDQEAVITVFPLFLDRRISQIIDLSKLTKLNDEAQAALDALAPVMRVLQEVRNNVAHAIVAEDNVHGHVFELRSKGRKLTKAQIFQTEELTNYAAHATLALRYALGIKDAAGMRFPLPERPEIPEFLRSKFQEPRDQKKARRSPPPQSLRG